MGSTEEKLAKQYMIESMFRNINREFEKIFGNKNGKNKNFWKKYNLFKEDIISDYMNINGK